MIAFLSLRSCSCWMLPCASLKARLGIFSPSRARSVLGRNGPGHQQADTDGESEARANGQSHIDPHGVKLLAFHIVL